MKLGRLRGGRVPNFPKSDTPPTKAHAGVGRFLDLTGAVMAGLAPAIHVFDLTAPKTWMPATSASMTTNQTSRSGRIRRIRVCGGVFTPMAVRDRAAVQFPKLHRGERRPSQASSPPPRPSFPA